MDLDQLRLAALERAGADLPGAPSEQILKRAQEYMGFLRSGRAGQLEAARPIDRAKKRLQHRRV